jgi:hypothetical protein
MKMITKYFVLTTMMCSVLALHVEAQRSGGAGHGMREIGKEERQERIKALKVAYITRELSLTEREAQVFWPVYNKHSDLREQKQMAIMQSRAGSGGNGVQSYSGESVKMLDEYFRLRQEELEAERQYYQAIREVLPEPKVALLLQAEHRFHREVLASLKAGAQSAPSVRPLNPGRPMPPR